jgi:opacity protein-like surface antigen
MRVLLAGSLVLFLFGFGSSPARGQVALGPEISVAEDVDLGIGAVIEAPLTSVYEELEFAGRFTVYFPDAGDYWEINGDVRYLFPLEGENALLPYVLGGIAIGHSSWDYDVPGQGGTGSDTEIALRIGGGFKVPMDRITPFAELGLGIGDLPDFTLRGGLTFPLG